MSSSSSASAAAGQRRRGPAASARDAPQVRDQHRGRRPFPSPRGLGDPLLVPPLPVPGPLLLGRRGVHEEVPDGDERGAERLEGREAAVWEGLAAATIAAPLVQPVFPRRRRLQEPSSGGDPRVDCLRGVAALPVADREHEPRAEVVVGLLAAVVVVVVAAFELLLFVFFFSPVFLLPLLPLFPP